MSIGTAAGSRTNSAPAHRLSKIAHSRLRPCCKSQRDFDIFLLRCLRIRCRCIASRGVPARTLGFKHRSSRMADKRFEVTGVGRETCDADACRQKNALTLKLYRRFRNAHIRSATSTAPWMSFRPWTITANSSPLRRQTVSPGPTQSASPAANSRILNPQLHAPANRSHS